MPSDETEREIYRATFRGVEELSDQIKEAMERQASKVYAYSLRRAADSIRSMKFVEHAHDKLIRLAEDEERAISPNEPERGPLADVLPPDCWICGREVSESPLIRRVVHRQCEEGRLAALEDAQEKVAGQEVLEERHGSRLPEDARQLALLARALGIRSNPETEHVLPNEDRDSLVDHADAVLDALKVDEPEGFRLSRDAFVMAHNIAHVADHYDLGEPQVGAVAPVNIADLRNLRGALHEGETPHLSIEVCEYGTDPESPLDFLSHEETQAKLQQARHVSVPDETVEALAMAIDLVFAEDFTVGPDLGLKLASVQKCHAAYRDRHPLGADPVEDEEPFEPKWEEPMAPVECAACRAWHQPPACTKEGAKT